MAKGKRRTDGELHNSKLTAADVHDVRLRIARGETQASIAKKYEITQTAISRIKTGENWSWLK